MPFTVTITEKGGATNVRDFDQPEVTIGRIQGNDIVLPKSNISKRHARIIYNSGSFVVIDSKSTNGTYINGKRIDAPYDLRLGDKIFVGDFTLEVEAQEAKKPTPPPPPQDEFAASTRDAAALREDELLSDDEWGASGSMEDDWDDDWGRDDGTASAAEELVEEGPKPRKPAQKPRPRRPAPERPTASGRSVGRGPSEISSEESVALRTVHERLLRSLDLRRMDVEHMDDEELRAKTRDAVEDIVRSMGKSGELPSGVDPAVLIDSVLDEALGLGPIEDLLADDSVTEIMINGAKRVYIERDGRLQRSDKVFSSDQAVLGVIERIVAPLGRRIDESSPFVDARLRDGSRVNAIIPPLALAGPTLTIRKFTAEPLMVDDLVVGGTLTADMAEFLETCVRARKNILISGGTGSGKTTTLNVMSSYLPASDRIITIEDAAELKLDQEHVVRLEARPPNIEGKGEISIRDLVRNALRMRPDRIVVGECRGGEALDMLQAMNTGHDGSLTTVHANGPRDALARLETMVLMSGMDLPIRAIRDQIASAVDIVVHQVRFGDGSRRITHISEVTGMEGDIISMQDIFVFKQQGVGSGGKVRGEFRATGFVPRFYEDLDAMGIPANMAIFQG